MSSRGVSKSILAAEEPQSVWCSKAPSKIASRKYVGSERAALRVAIRSVNQSCGVYALPPRQAEI